MIYDLLIKSNLPKLKKFLENIFYSNRDALRSAHNVE